MRNARVLPLCIALLFCGWGVNSSLTVDIKAKKETCFYEDLTKGTEVDFDVFVSKGGLLDIRAKVAAPSDGVNAYNVIHQELVFSTETAPGDSADEVAMEKSRITTHTFTPDKTGTYKFCLDNTMSRWTPKTVTFDIIVGGRSSGRKASSGVEKSDVAPMSKWLGRLEDGTRSIQFQQRAMRRMESVHHALLETSNSSIKWAAVVETGVVVCVALFQVFFVRQWFESGGEQQGGNAAHQWA